MTTIAANLALGVMAADARATLYSRTTGEQLHAFPSTKLQRIGEWIVGCAGNQEDIDAFMRWIHDRRKRRRKVKEDFEALMLSRTKLLYVGDDASPEPVRDGFMAIGSGGGFALASLTTQRLLGLEPDPRLAVSVACVHDTHSAPPIDFLTWRKG